MVRLYKLRDASAEPLFRLLIYRSTQSPLRLYTYLTASEARSEMARRREERAGGGQRDVGAALERYQLHGIRETGEELGRGSYAAVIEVYYKGMRCAAKRSTISCVAKETA